MALDLDVNTAGEDSDTDARTRRGGLGHTGNVGLVHLVKVLVASDEDVALDNVVDRRAVGLEDCLEVVDTLVLSS